MLKDCILVIAGIMVFMIPAILQKGRRSQLKYDFPCQLSKMAVLSGLFVSIVELVVLIADLENILGQNGKELFPFYPVAKKKLPAWLQKATQMPRLPRSSTFLQKR